MAKKILVVYSEFDSLPRMLLIDSLAPEGVVAEKCDGLIINNNDEAYSSECVDYVTFLERNTNLSRELTIDYDQDTIVRVINCGFAP